MAKRYVTVFRKPFEAEGQLPLSSQEEHTLQACSLLAIPPPSPGNKPPQGGLPRDLSEINITHWISIVEDVAHEVQGLPPWLSSKMGGDVSWVSLLQRLEQVTQISFCRHCYQPGLGCRCRPPTSTFQATWSQPAAAPNLASLPQSEQGGASAMPPPPPGLPVLNPLWATVRLQRPQTPAPSTMSGAFPPLGTPQLTQRAVLWAFSSFRKAPIRQSHPTTQQAKGSTPYQQVAHPPLHTTGVRFTTPATPTTTTSAGSTGSGALQAQKATVGQQSTADQPPCRPTGRGHPTKWLSQTRPGQPPTTGGRPPRGGSSSRGGARGRGQRPLYSSGGASQQPAPGSASQEQAPGSAEPYIAQLRKFKSQGWKKDLSRILRPFFDCTCPPERMAEWKVLKNQFFKHLLTCMAEWKEIKETDPLQFMPYLEEQFFQQIGICLTGLGTCTQWIKPGSFYHRRVFEQGLVNRCPHLEGLAIPPPQALPTMQALEGHQKALAKGVEAVRKAASDSIERLGQREDAYTANLRAQGKDKTIGHLAKPEDPAPMEVASQTTSGSGDAPHVSWADQSEYADSFQRQSTKKRK